MLAALALTVASALGATDSYPPPPLIQADVPMPAPEPSRAHFGLLVDAGLPDGAGASITLLPTAWLRFHVGVLSNGVSPGFRGGLTLAPFHFGITPIFSVEAGHYLEGDANQAVRMITQDMSFHSDALTRFGYDFANAQVGFEVGPPDRWAFYVKGGASYLRPSLAVPVVAQQAIGQAAHGAIQFDSNGSMFLPSLKVGITIYFL
jgi:hypothetical protein